MKQTSKGVFRSAVLIRIAVDVVLTQIALVVALVVRYVGVFAFQNPNGSVDLREISDRYSRIYYENAFFLTCLIVAALAVAGVYTRRRLYLGRFKALVVLQAVTFAFLTYGMIGFLFRQAVDFPRLALLFAYVATVALLVGARLFLTMWLAYAHDERMETAESLVEEDRDRILVVGGAGYIGSALVPQLLADGHRVRVLDLMMFGDEPLSSVANHPNLEIVPGDFRNSGCLATAMRNVHTVVHLAGIVGDPACNLDERLTIDVNLFSTRSIADMAKWMGIRRFVFASTCSVYGACDEQIDEKSQAKPVSLYGNTKLASERVLRELADDDFSPTILRFATIYGLSGRTRFDLVVNLLTAKAKVDGKITVFNGRQWRPFVHVSDAARGIKTIIQAPIELVHNQIFNVGSNDQNHTILDVGEMVHEQVIGAELLVDESGADARNYRVDFAKIRSILDFQPKWTVEAGIQQVLDAISSGKVDNYRDPKYSNHDYLNLQGTSELARDHWAVELIRDLEGVERAATR